MSLKVATWEYRLLSLAHEAFTTPAIESPIQPETAIMESAYRECARITRTHSRTFYMAASLLPEDKQRAVHALYAFCRCTDDLVDETENRLLANEMLTAWRARLTCLDGTATNDPVPLAWADAQARYSIPRGYADQLITGVARDLTQQRYDSFADLTEYCYGVASTVGLMSMHIVGFQNRDALPFAIKLGIALQLTNILRDIGEDWQAGRLYLPLEELDEFGLSEADIAAARVDERWRAFMRFQIERVHRLYEEAAPGIALLHREGRFAIAAAAELYRAILTDISAHDYNVFRRRAHIGFWGKARRLPAIWWNSRF